MWPNPQETVDLVALTEEILNGKIHFCVQRFLRFLTPSASITLGIYCTIILRITSFRAERPCPRMRTAYMFMISEVYDAFANTVIFSWSLRLVQLVENLWWEIYNLLTCGSWLYRMMVVVWDHSFSTYAKFSENITFLTPWYAHISGRIKG